MTRKFRNYEEMIFRYIDALERGQIEEIAVFLEYAEQDPTLEAMILEVNDAYYEEYESSLLTESFLGEPVEELRQGKPAPPVPTLSSPPEAIQPASFWPQIQAGLVGAVFGMTALALAFLILPNLRQAFMPQGTMPGKASLAAVGLSAHLPPGFAPSKPSRAAGPLPSPPHSSQRGAWLRDNWVNAIHHNPDVLVHALQKGAVRKDLLALMQNQHLPAAIARQLPSAKLSAFHRAVRARMFLRMARFHRKNYDLALAFNQAVLQRRLKRSSRLRLGRLFHLYWGRLLCLQGNVQGAALALQRALLAVPTARRERVLAWLTVCQVPLNKDLASQRLATLRFSDDPDGWADWVLIHTLFRIPTKHNPVLTTARARMYSRVWKHQPVRWLAPVLRTSMDREAIKERSIATTQHYYDPAMFLMMSYSYGQQALRYLEHMPSSDRYAAFYQAEAYQLLGRRSEALERYLHFQRHAPTQIQWSYLLFSHRLSPRFLRYEARYRYALLLGTDSPQSAKLELLALAKEGGLAKPLAGLGLLQLKVRREQGYRWILDGVDVARREGQRLYESMLVAAERGRRPKEKRGAQAILQLRLHRYVVRALYLWGGQGALLMKDSDRATRWMENLHSKSKPYQIADINEPSQFIGAAKAYAHAGKLGVATLFFAKNLKTYPSLTQLWSLLRIWRIFEGMNGVPRVKRG
ncbi:MAG: hypothetical protein EP343_25805 [Deltaproteobacteria bacterium]|nr:MAG: hypothetical protein EP343_25805 [Deltaproteobacteria bacterium]